MTIDNITPEDWDQAIDRRAINNQVGGGHYNGLKIQPKEYVYANNLSPCLSDCLKYITRNKGDKQNRIEDLKKAIHSIELELQLTYGVDVDGNDIGNHVREFKIKPKR